MLPAGEERLLSLDPSRLLKYPVMFKVPLVELSKSSLIGLGGSRPRRESSAARKLLLRGRVELGLNGVRGCLGV